MAILADQRDNLLLLYRIGNAWAAKGMLNVASIIEKSHIGNTTAQVTDLKRWVKEILKGTFARLVGPMPFAPSQLTDAFCRTLMTWSQTTWTRSGMIRLEMLQPLQCSPRLLSVLRPCGHQSSRSLWILPVSNIAALFIHRVQ
jgi:hypothetical protein